MNHVINNNSEKIEIQITWDSLQLKRSITSNASR